MKKSLLVISAILLATSLSACTRSDEGTVVGGVGGAALGNVLTGGSALGTAVGAVGGAVVGNNIAR
jgi:outer membrane lipoprotein SlyB